MVRDKLISLISDTLSIDKTFIFEEANLRLLCILSNHLEGLDDVAKNKVKINRDGLKESTLENIEYKDRTLLIDIKSLFEKYENKNVIYNDCKGRDGFYNFQILEVLLILEIEREFDIQIPDEEVSNILIVGQALSYIAESIK